MTDPRWLDADGRELPEEDRGLTYDVRTLVARRHVLGLFGGVGAAALLTACSDGSAPATTASQGSGSGTTTQAAGEDALVEVPDETGGPFPGDGSNGVDVLDDSGIVRTDITSSFGASTAAVPGVPLTLTMTVLDPSSGKPFEGAAVYVWHCDAAGRYSLYSDGVTGENWLRGVQPVAADGTVTFRSVVPGCYQGRWPHVHFEVYRTLADATGSGPVVKTSQLAFPKAACEAVYGTKDYTGSADALAGLSLEGDMVFRDDGAVHQLATMSGDPTGGYTATLTVGVPG
jgi:protocatechuate 3,4-dioxygenase beta subunit